jgi:hypothetical protein
MSDTRFALRQGTAVGVAQHHPARARVVGLLGAFQREVAIRLVAVEEVLRVEHDLRLALGHVGHAFGDHGHVLRGGDAERDLDVEVPGLADHADHVRRRVGQAGQAGIVGGAAARPPGHAEGHQPRGGECRRIGEEGVVGRVGARPAAFHVVDPQIVERPGDGDLVRHVEIDALGLRPVAQGRIVQIDALVVAHLGSQSLDVACL